MRRIVDDLLWLARADSLPDPPLNQLVDLGTLAREAADRFRPIAEARSSSLDFIGHEVEGPFVLAPADWLERLLSVLLDNACRYSEAGARIEVSTRCDTRRAVLVVDDSGPGIADSELDEVPRRFRRASLAPGGAGLGLSIADTIVRETDAAWRISRAPLGGARMEVSWPDRGPRVRALSVDHAAGTTLD